MSKKQKCLLVVLILVLAALCGVTVGRAQTTLSEQIYIPIAVHHTPVETIPITVTGSIVNCQTLEPYIGFPLRSADVYYHQWIVLDLAFSPGAYTDMRGRFSMTFIPLAGEQIIILGWLDMFFYYYEWGPLYQSYLNGQQIDLGVLCVNIDNLVAQSNNPLELFPSQMRELALPDGYILEVK